VILGGENSGLLKDSGWDYCFNANTSLGAPALTGSYWQHGEDDWPELDIDGEGREGQVLGLWLYHPTDIGGVEESGEQGRLLAPTSR